MSSQHEAEYYKIAVYARLHTILTASCTGHAADTETCTFHVHVNIHCSRLLHLMFFFDKAVMCLFHNNATQWY